MGLVNFIGSAFLAGAKMGLGAAKMAGYVGFGGAKIIGRGTIGASKAIGKGFFGASKAVGKPIVAPFESAENRRRTGENYLDLFKDVGNTIVHKNKEGEMKLTKRGLAIIGGVTLGVKAKDAWFDAKANNLGTVDQKPVTHTPNYNPVQYEMAPQKRIHPDSGGATGDLVFALHRNR